MLTVARSPRRGVDYDSRSEQQEVISRSTVLRSMGILLPLLLVLGCLEAGRRGVAAKLLKSGRQAVQTNDFRPAEKHLRWAYRLRPESSRIRLELTMCLQAMGDARGADELLATISDAASSPDQAWRTRLTRAEVAMAVGRSGQAIAAFELLLEDLRTVAPFAEKTRIEIRALRGFGRVLDDDFGRTEMAAARLQEALEIATAAKLPNERAWSLLELATFERTHRRDLRFRVDNRLRPALDLFEASGNRLGQAAVLGALARIAREEKNLPRQAELLEQASQLYQLTGHRLGPVRIEYYRATRDSNMEHYNEAYQRYSSCRRSFANLGQQSGVRVVDIGLAALSLRTGRLQQAQAQLESLLTPLGPTPHRRHVLWLLGLVHLHAGEPQAAMETYQQVLRMDHQLHPGNTASLSEVLAMLGQAGLQMGDLDSAEQALAESRRLASEHGSADSMTVALLSSADLAELSMSMSSDPDRQDQQAEQALAFLEAAIDLQANHQDAVLSPFFFTHFWQSLERLRSLLLEWSLRDDVKARAHRALFRLLEEMRYRSQRGLSHHHLPRPPTKTKAEIAAWRRLANQLAGAASGKPASDDLRAAYQRYQQTVFDAQVQQSSSLSDRRAPASLAVLQAALPSDTAIVLYAYGDENVFALLVGSESEVAVALPIKRQEVEDKVGLLLRLLSEQIAASAGDALAAAPLQGGETRRWQPVAQALHRALIKPLYSAGLEPGMALGIVPIGAVNDLPFASLMAGNGTFLIEDHVVWTAPSASAMIPDDVGARDDMSKSGFVAFGVDRGVDGPRLPAAAIEARELAKQMGGQAWVSSQATEQALRLQLPAEWLHIAAHGQIEPDLPLLSRLAFAKPPEKGNDPAADGRLTVEEILSLNMTSDLVVLSSCRASANFTSREDDWAAERLGLGGAFLAAGARRVISSQLPIADTSAHPLMLELYQELRSWPPAQALHRVQRRHVAAEDVAWMGFGMMGWIPDRDIRPLLSVEER